MTNNVTLHPKYQLLFEEHPEVRYVIISGGRGSGKSFATSLYLASKFVTSIKNCMYLRQFMVNADSSTIPQFLAQVEVLHLNRYFKVKHGEIENPNGVKLFFKGFATSLNAADSQLKSIPNLETIVIEEATEVSEKDFDKLNLSIRDKDAHPKLILAFNPSDEKHWIYERFFKSKEVHYDYNGIVGNTLYIHTTFEDNADHLDDTFLEEAENVKNSNLLKYNNLFLGQWLADNQNALWTATMIEEAHQENVPPPKYDEIVIGLDPAVTANKTSDETGIIVAGRKGKQIYVMHEFTNRYTPNQWGKLVCELYNRLECSYVIAETNQGGDLVVQNIKNIDPHVLVKTVHASRGKILRAEPVAGLYQAHQVKHLKAFPKLEEEQMTYCGDPKQKSPNSLDAAVYAITFLSNHKNDHSGF